MLSIRTLAFWSSCFSAPCPMWRAGFSAGSRTDWETTSRRRPSAGPLFGGGRSILFWRLPQPSFGVLKRTSRWCRSPFWQPWWRSSALQTADCVSEEKTSYRKPSSSGSGWSWSVSQAACSGRMAGKQPQVAVCLCPFIARCVVSVLFVFKLTQPGCQQESLCLFGFLNAPETVQKWAGLNLLCNNISHRQGWITNRAKWGLRLLHIN